MQKKKNRSVMQGWVTINTDAGWYAIDKVGSFAYWIKGDGLHLKGSGMLKGDITSSTQAEQMAIINALHLLKKSGHKPITKIIFNRDNIYTTSKKKGSELEKITYTYLREIFDKNFSKKHSITFGAFYQFRHVRAHQKDTPDARTWVNQWLDAQCRKELLNWKLTVKNAAKSA